MGGLLLVGGRGGLACGSMGGGLDGRDGCVGSEELVEAEGSSLLASICRSLASIMAILLEVLKVCVGIQIWESEWGKKRTHRDV